MKKTGFMHWLIRLIRRDMAQYEEDVGAKQEISRAYRQKQGSKCPKIVNKYK